MSSILPTIICKMLHTYHTVVEDGDWIYIYTNKLGEQLPEVVGSIFIDTDTINVRCVLKNGIKSSKISVYNPAMLALIDDALKDKMCEIAGDSNVTTH